MKSETMTDIETRLDEIIKDKISSIDLTDFFKEIRKEFPGIIDNIQWVDIQIKADYFWRYENEEFNCKQEMAWCQING